MSFGNHRAVSYVMSVKGMALIFQHGLPDIEVRLSTVWPPFSHELEADDFVEPIGAAGYRRAFFRRKEWEITPARNEGALRVEGPLIEFNFEGPMDDPRAEVVAQVFVDAQSGQLLWADRLMQPIRWTTPGTIEVLPALVWPGAE